MAKPDLGGKRQCQNCGTKFFDLNKDPIICPKCGTVFQLAASARTARPAAQEDEEPDTETEAEVVPLEDADQVEDGKVLAVVEEDVDLEEEAVVADDDDTFLEEEEEDDGDVADLIDGDIEDDEER